MRKIVLIEKFLRFSFFLGFQIQVEFSSSPKKVSKLPKIEQIAAGEYYSLVLDDNGVVYSWGHPKNIGRRLDAIPNRVPGAISLPLSKNTKNVKILKIVCGPEHAAIFSERKLFTFGSNCFGQLGIGAVSDCELEPKEVPTFFSTVLEKIIDVSCGRHHTACIVGKRTPFNDRIVGELYLWGRNSSGQLGLENPQNVLSPQESSLINVKQVVCGDDHTLVLTVEGRLYATGSKEHGVLGIHVSENVKLFRSIDPKMFRDGEIINRIYCSGTFNVAISERNVYTWGKQEAQSNANLRHVSEAPAETIRICCGIGFTLVLTKRGTVYSWGPNAELLGHPKKEPQSAPMLIEALKNEKIVDIATGHGKIKKKKKSSD